MTKRERDVLVELCRSMLGTGAFTEPASTRRIAEALVVSDAAVKQHLIRLYDKFAIYVPRARLCGDDRRVDRPSRRRVGSNGVQARDVLWLCSSPELYQLLVQQRGWTPQQLGAFVVDTMGVICRDRSLQRCCPARRMASRAPSSGRQDRSR